MYVLKHLSVTDLCELYPAVFCVDAGYKQRASILETELCTPPLDLPVLDVIQAAV